MATSIHRKRGHHSSLDGMGAKSGARMSSRRIVLTAAIVILLYQLSNIAMDVLYKYLNPPAWGPTLGYGG